MYLLRADRRTATLTRPNPLEGSPLVGIPPEPFDTSATPPTQGPVNRAAESQRGSRRSGGRRLPKRAAASRRSFTSTLKSLDDLASSGAKISVNITDLDRGTPVLVGRRLRDAAGRRARHRAAADRGRGGLRVRAPRSARDHRALLGRSRRRRRRLAAPQGPGAAAHRTSRCSPQRPATRSPPTRCWPASACPRSARGSRTSGWSARRFSTASATSAVPTTPRTTRSARRANSRRSSPPS